MQKVLVLIIIVLVVIIGYMLFQQDCACEQKGEDTCPVTGDSSGDTLSFVTEDYPPFTYADASGEPTGLVTDVVKEIMAKQGITETISLVPWKDAYNKALRNKNVVIFSINRTNEREDLFNWIGPIAKSSTVFYAKKGSGITINELNDAREVASIGVVDDWYSKQDLEGRGFNNLVSSELPSDAITKLMNGEVKILPLTDITAESSVTKAGYNIEDLEALYTMDTGYVYIGMSIGTSESIVKKWQEDFEALKFDGTFEQIYKSYRPDDDIEDLLN